MSADPQSRFTPEERELLLQTAADSIEYGLHRGEAFPVIPATFPPSLQEPGASFVTLDRHGTLRGCIGTLRAYQPLIVDVSENAFAAANRDDRFPAVRLEELEDMEIHVSVLTPPEVLDVSSEEELIAALRPGTDGAILEEGRRRGTFLPQVWEQCTDARDFVHALKRKAGLPPDYWSPGLKAFRYTVESIP